MKALPDGRAGAWAVETFTVSKRDSEFTRMRAMFSPGEYVPEGTYRRLTRNSSVIMSNTPMEIRTNRAIVWAAKGRTLINGLGLGMVPSEILKKGELTELWIVEKELDVIKLVAPSLTDERVKIIHGDAFEFTPPKGVRFDAVWHDIWDDICSDNLGEMTKLKRKYGRRADWQGCWGQAECQRNSRRGW